MKFYDIKKQNVLYIFLNMCLYVYTCKMELVLYFNLSSLKGY